MSFLKVHTATCEEGSGKCEDGSLTCLLKITPHGRILFCFHILSLYRRRDVRQDREVIVFIAQFSPSKGEMLSIARQRGQFAPPLDPLPR